MRAYSAIPTLSAALWWSAVYLGDLLLLPLVAILLSALAMLAIAIIRMETPR